MRATVAECRGEERKEKERMGEARNVYMLDEMLTKYGEFVRLITLLLAMYLSSFPIFGLPLLPFLVSRRLIWILDRNTS